MSFDLIGEIKAAGESVWDEYTQAQQDAMEESLGKAWGVVEGVLLDIFGDHGDHH
ncbi:hypothetical protein IT409_02525 [Candidatus Falkowbacteria bacterium]|nr:hypothetical protein [Candidatus Falkowbacteria bacterium]